MHKKLLFILLFCICLQGVRAQAKLGIETGIVFSGYNNARIPGDIGTRFSLSRELSSKPFLFYRLNADYTLNNKHTFALLFAPLSTSYSGSINRDIFFLDRVFPANTPLEATYKFNSYRLTYRYEFVRRPRFEFGLGLTAKIRDAKIALASPFEESTKTDLGVVPLINFRLFTKIRKLGVLFQGDALAAPQGRAEDILLAGTYQLTKALQFQLGYRMLEGGGDNDEVYTFSNFNYIVIGVNFSFL